MPKKYNIVCRTCKHVGKDRASEAMARTDRQKHLTTPNQAHHDVKIVVTQNEE